MDAEGKELEIQLEAHKDGEDRKNWEEIYKKKHTMTYDPKEVEITVRLIRKLF